tara:strand:- start:262 stop:438 length:177 start_codon:yes stop_codon:yes gene_type:complete
MDLINGAVLLFGTIGTVALLGWDPFENRKPITKTEMQQSQWVRPAKSLQKRRVLLNRG